MKIGLRAALLVLAALWAGLGWAYTLDVPHKAFRLLAPDGSRQIGWAEFDAAEQKRHPSHLRVKYGFANGEYDIDESWLKPTPLGQIPELRKYRHGFFGADGSLERLSEADLTSGQATCSIYKAGEVQRTSKALDFPADTYAGPALVLPIRNFLRNKVPTEQQFHIFNCSPGPNIYTINITANALPHWVYHEGPVLEAIITPHFGFFDVLISPFVPDVRLWFDPLRDYDFIGAKSVRYYRGPAFLMVPERNLGAKGTGGT